VSFLFTDVEGSTRLWEADSGAMREALSLHDDVVRGAIEGHRGYLFATGGDGFAAAFWSVGDAVGAAAAAQAGLQLVPWPAGLRVAVRMGIHTGEAVERGGDYFGPTLNRAARVMAAGHGGQVLLSGAAAELYGTARLQDLGEHRLKDLSAPEHVWQLGGDPFSPLRTLDRAPHNLPTQRTPLLGRETDIEAVARHLGGHRLVSLIGMGGSGKTRLAQAAAAAVVGQFPDGVWFIDLVPVSAAPDGGDRCTGHRARRSRRGPTPTCRCAARRC
jgi:hypothetical protein